MGSGTSLVDVALEVKALKEILTPGSKYGNDLYSICKDEYFNHPATKTLYLRLKQLLSGSSTMVLPTLQYMLSDSKISENIKTAFLQVAEDLPPIETEGDYTLLIEGLSRLSSVRTVVRAAQDAGNALLRADDPHTQLRRITEELGESILKIDDNEDINTQVSLGAGFNQAAEESFYRILNGQFNKNMVKTGFRDFDERTGGHNRTNLVVISANSGGGKSLFALNIMVRQYRLGYTPFLASYEMSEDEVMVRLLALISEVDMNKIINHTITKGEQRRIICAFREFNAIGARKGNSYHIVCPKSETTVAEIGFRAKAYKPDTIILDYINLLNSANSQSEQQWQQLGNIAKESKILANKLNAVVYLLAQLDDSYNLRYSKGIKDHANFVMGWIRDEVAIQERVITVHQMKARNAPVYDWQLQERFDIAQFRDLGQEDRSIWPTDDEHEQHLNELKAKGLYYLPLEERQKAELLEKEEDLSGVVPVNNEGSNNDESLLEVTINVPSPMLLSPPPDKPDKVPYLGKKKSNLLYSEEDEIPEVDFSKVQVNPRKARSLVRHLTLHDDDVL